MPRESLRFLTPRDAEALTSLRHHAVPECPSAFGTPPALELSRGPAHYRRQLLQMRLGQSARWIGLWCGPQLLGVTGIRRRLETSRPYGLVFSMYVLPQARGKGRGTRLLLAAQRHLRQSWNLPECRLQVEIHNAGALHLYERCGFHILRRVPDAFRLGHVSHDLFLLSDSPHAPP